MGSTTRDGRALPPGPWIEEPDKLHWVDEESDLDCLIVRGPLGALCGYVGVPPEHPYHGAEYDDVPVSVHGGLTYADKCMEDHPDAICHVPLPGRSPDMWWLGFDCGHAGDFIPGMDRDIGIFGDATYKTIEYVRNEVVTLARQLALFVAGEVIEETLALEG